MRTSQPEYLRQLIAQGEHVQLDFKFEISDARKIARTLSAFSNTQGGTLLIGVKDNGRVSGIRSEEEIYMVESAAGLYCKPEVHFDSYMHQQEGKTVLEVYIPPVRQKPVYARDEKGRWLAYVRVADENMLASIIHLNLWKAEHQDQGSLLEFSRKEQLLLELLKKEDAASLKTIQRNSGFPRKELISLLGKLASFDVVQISYEAGEARFGFKENPGDLKTD
jgi:predicted HTH transcriptional regulator